MIFFYICETFIQIQIKTDINIKYFLKSQYGIILLFLHFV